MRGAANRTRPARKGRRRVNALTHSNATNANCAPSRRPSPLVFDIPARFPKTLSCTLAIIQRMYATPERPRARPGGP
jgi:hypothetical protein